MDLKLPDIKLFKPDTQRSISQPANPTTSNSIDISKIPNNLSIFSKSRQRDATNTSKRSNGVISSGKRASRSRRGSNFQSAIIPTKSTPKAPTTQTNSPAPILVKNFSSRARNAVRKVNMASALFPKKFKKKASFNIDESPTSNNSRNSARRRQQSQKMQDVYEQVPFLSFPSSAYSTNIMNKTEPGGASTRPSEPISKFYTFESLQATDEFQNETERYLKKLIQRQKRTNSVESNETIQQLNMRLSFNQRKRKRYINGMKSKAKEYFDKVIKMSSDWNRKKFGEIMILKRTNLSELRFSFKSGSKPVLRPVKTLGSAEKRKKAKKNSKRLAGSRDLLEGSGGEFGSAGKSGLLAGIGMDQRIRASAHIMKMAWLDNSELHIAKNFPSCEGIGSVYYKGRVLFFGGMMGKDLNSKIYVFDARNLQFSTMEVKGGPAPSGRCFHSMSLIEGSKVVIFGGEFSYTGFGSRMLFMETWVLDLKLREWMKASSDLSASLPSPRKHHAVCSFGRYMLVSGGIGQEESFLKDWWAFDAETHIWKEVLVDLRKWEPISKHRMAGVFKQAPKDLYTKGHRHLVYEGPRVGFFSYSIDFTLISSRFHQFQNFDFLDFC